VRIEGTLLTVKHLEIIDIGRGSEYTSTAEGVTCFCGEKPRRRGFYCGLGERCIWKEGNEVCLADGRFILIH
jgi:hypothetical protein